jgi:molybdopterin-synthase adenylyltransferase
MEKKPLVTAALGQFDGSLTTVRAHESGPDGRPNPTYRCLFPSPPLPGAIPLAQTVIREIVGLGRVLSNVS